ncbi:MAG TPA: AbrB/MazE/SpoVT family DNA-binding domain-containing protein [Patescibacteria group bacterium]|nr:AbrB/MazE/SpoVT family DNA-binding domain-containing protein [Patescibacteria group bacterium]
MAQKVIKTGNSLAVTIPWEFVDLVGIRPGDEVELEIKTEKGEITYLFSGMKQLPLSENFLKTRRKAKRPKS